MERGPQISGRIFKQPRTKFIITKHARLNDPKTYVLKNGELRRKDIEAFREATGLLRKDYKNALRGVKR